MSLTKTQALEILDALVEHIDRKVAEFTERAGTDRARKKNHLAAASFYRLEGEAVRMALTALIKESEV